MFNKKSVDKRTKRDFTLIYVIVVIFILFLSLLIYLNKSLEKIFQCDTNSKKIYLSANYHNGKNHHSSSDSPSLCFIVRLNNKQISYLPVLILSLHHGDLTNYQFYIVETDQFDMNSRKYLSETILFLKNHFEDKDFIKLLKFDSIPTNINEMNNQILNYFYNKSKTNVSECEYVTITNADKLFARNFGSKVSPFMKTKQDIISWSFISDFYLNNSELNIYPKDDSPSNLFDDGTQKCILTLFDIGFLDFTAVTYRLEFLQQYQIYFESSPSFLKTETSFVQYTANLTNASVILRQTLIGH